MDERVHIHAACMHAPNGDTNRYLEPVNRAVDIHNMLYRMSVKVGQAGRVRS